MHCATMLMRIEGTGWKKEWGNTVIIAPELEPVTNTFLLSAPYSLIVQVTMLAIELLFPPPLCVSVACELTSQQPPEYGLDG